MNNGFILPLTRYLYVISWNIFALQAGTKTNLKTLMELQNKPPTLGSLTSNLVCFILFIMYFKVFILEMRTVADSSFHGSLWFIASKNDHGNSNVFLSTILWFYTTVWNEVGGMASKQADSLLWSLLCHFRKWKSCIPRHSG